MIVDVAVDVGNTRIKWGRCEPERVVEMASLPPDDPIAWQQQRERWQLAPGSAWCLSGVHPQRRDHLAQWLLEQGERVMVLKKAADLPLQVSLPEPDRVGIDRLLNAVAANSRRRSGVVALIVDAGSAVTVDFVGGLGTEAFCGGAILPGFRLMAEALHAYTALLPLVEVTGPMPPLGRDTREAMQAGIFAAVVGGIEQLIWRHDEEIAQDGVLYDVYVTGGDGRVIADALQRQVQWWPEMTLEGVRLSAAALAPT